eukprot:TRINITY_DN13739_c0_g1_i2.p2 TRINITY_DN13739_c0_g1~~TRINITY_DN13739_c0_g1_i2.p2  ORF type:complete len:100 (-),score=1.02 TRINITY_DN13739_c0_g1_i2:83-382(-)
MGNIQRSNDIFGSTRFLSDFFFAISLSNFLEFKHSQLLEEGLKQFDFFFFDFFISLSYIFIYNPQILSNLKPKFKKTRHSQKTKSIMNNFLFQQNFVTS